MGALFMWTSSTDRKMLTLLQRSPRKSFSSTSSIEMILPSAGATIWPGVAVILRSGSRKKYRVKSVATDPAARTAG